jgi:hypothetical protein
VTAYVPESEFTPPRPDCPHPEHWTAADADSAELEVSELVGVFVRALQPEVVVETGTAFGQTAHHIAEALRRNGHGHLWTLEPDPLRADSAQQRLAHLPATVVRAESLTYTPRDGIGFAWFDSLTHLRESEFRRYRPHMAPGCIVGFHDCGPQHPVRVHVERLAREGLLRPIYLPTPRGVMFAEVL